MYQPLPRGLLIVLMIALVSACSKPLPDDLHAKTREIPAWFDEAKLGIFIHWGPASVPAFSAGEVLGPGELEEALLGNGRQELPYAEWYLFSMTNAQSKTAQHHKATYGDAPYRDFGSEFERRVNSRWKPEAWADLFATVGARYVVLVTKHHDGYTLWPSDVVNPHQQNWGSQRDMVGELAAAVRQRGMRFGTYYSTGLDWTFSLTSEGDLVRDVLRSAPRSQAYAEYAKAHLEELTARYKPDVMWADIGYPAKGELAQVLSDYFAQVPEGVVNDRWAALDTLGWLAQWPGATSAMKWLGRKMLADNHSEPTDDPNRIGFKTEEYNSSPVIPPYKWEATRGLGASFAFNAAETAEDMLSANQLIEFLVDTVAKNGNLLINVGPDSYGSIPSIQKTPLLGLGDWLATNGEAVYGTRPWQRFNNQIGSELRYTAKQGMLYATVFDTTGDTLVIEHPAVEWKEIQVLGNELEKVDVQDDLITLTLVTPVTQSATVVRYTLARDHL